MNKRTLIIVGIIIGLYLVYNYAIPLNKNNGTEYNSKRSELGIPQITKNLKHIPEWSTQFETVWYNENSKTGHFKKVVEYGILNAKSETDYYKSENAKGTFTWSKYDYENNTSEYFIEKPNDKNVALTESGKLKIEKPTIIQKIDKSEFEKYIAE